MVYEFKFPDVGEGITEGEIVRWYVKVGDIVKVDQTLGEIETDKAIVKIPSPKKGKIVKINFKEGGTVKVGETLVEIETGETVKEISKKESSSVVGEIEEAKGESVFERVKKKEVKVEGRVLATPAVRALAKSLNINLDKIKGSGVGGRISEEDVKHAAGQTTKVSEEEPVKIKITKKYDMYGYIDRVALKGVRKTIARRMIESQHVNASVTHVDEIDVSKLSEIREKEKIRLKKKIKLTYLPFIIKGIIKALKKEPYLNASIENEEIIIKKYYNIGIAVDTEDGLMVPVVKRAETKSLEELAKEIFSLAENARKRKLNIMDLKGGSFTITNVGSIGGLFSTPIINPPESGILALGRIYDKAVVINNKVEIRKMLPVSLTFDHRVLDGAQAARFTEELKGCLENPKTLV